MTERIAGLLGSLPIVGRLLKGIYLWKPMMFNFMIVGASGTVLSWLLYEGFFRILLVDFWGGTFIGLTITTLIVFMWNYYWNKRWSLKVDAQIGSMTKQELLDLETKVKVALSQKFYTDYVVNETVMR
jgi:hypothetical protein